MPHTNTGRAIRRPLIFKLGLALGVLCVGVVATLQVIQWHRHNFVPRQVLANRSRMWPTVDKNSIEYKVYWALKDRVAAGTISAAEMGEVWGVSFAHAIELGHRAGASRQADGGWRLSLDLPRQFRKSPTMVVTAALQTTEGVELVSKEVWTIELRGYSPDLTIEEIAQDERLETVITELPVDNKVVLTMAVRPWSDPDVEPQVVCRHVFSIEIVP